VLLSSHILSEISQTCDRLLVIQRGEIVAQGSEQDLATRMGGGGTIEVEVAGPSARAIEVARTVTGIGECSVMRESGGVALLSLQGRPSCGPRSCARWSRTESTCCASTAARRASSRSSLKLTQDRTGPAGGPQ
jgi:ABC-type multidrug transport system ATPase subunit